MHAESTNKTILVLFGGESPEHEVSIMSAKNVQAALKNAPYKLLFCYIDTSGAWWHVTTVAKPTGTSTRTTPVLGASAITINDQQIHIDTILPILHGQNGEDGSVQGLARLLHTPIVGCGIEGSVLCMNKILAKQLLESAGIPVVPYVTHHAAAAMPTYASVAEQLGPTLFVKPARQGSSVGIAKARTEAEFKTALHDALRYDTDILIEGAVPDVRELEIAVLGPNSDPQVTSVGEIVPDREFYSYESKYDGNSSSQSIIPADIPAETAARIQALATQAYALLRCRGLSRVDFFINGEGTVYLNEINTMPGFTDISMYSKLWDAAGMPYDQLVQTLIEQAA